MEKQIQYNVITDTENFALCKVASKHSKHYDRYVVLRRTKKDVNHWEPTSRHYKDRHPAESIYRRLIDGSKDM